LGFIEILIGIHREITNQNWDFVGDGDNLLKKMHYMYYEDGLFRPHQKVGDSSAPMCMAFLVNPHRLRPNMEIPMVYPMVYAIFCYDHPQKFAQNCCLSQGFRQWPAAPGAPEQEWIAIKVQPFK
jgi:hypothetical protein